MVYNYIQVVGQEMNGDIYNIRIPYTRKNELKRIFNLEEKGRNKEYWIYLCETDMATTLERYDVNFS